MCHVVSAADPYGRNLGFLDRNIYIYYIIYLFVNEGENDSIILNSVLGK
jgi:hypothetical protein